MRVLKVNRKRATIILLLVLVFSFLSVMMNEISQDAKAQDLIPQLTGSRMYLKESLGMDPVPPDEGDEYQTISIPNGFIRDGFFGLGILPIGHTYWRDVGSWSTQPLRQQVHLGGQVDVTMFAVKTGNSFSGNFEFLIMRQNEAQPLLRMSRGGVTVQGGGTEATRITATGTFPHGNDTTIDPDTQLVFKIRVQAQINDGGAVFRYGSKDYPSGFTFSSDALEPIALYMNQKSVMFEYKDAFLIPWVNMYTFLSVNGIEEPNTEITSQVNSANQTRMLIWERDNSPGQYELLASVSYDPTGWGNVSLVKTAQITKDKGSTFSQIGDFISGAWLIILLVIAIIASPFLLAKWRRTAWRKRFKTLPPEADDLSKHKKKKLWKKIRKDSKKARKEMKVERRERREKKKEEEKGSWSLFKKKPEDRKSEMAAELRDLDLDL